MLANFKKVFVILCHSNSSARWPCPPPALSARSKMLHCTQLSTESCLLLAERELCIYYLALWLMCRGPFCFPCVHHATSRQGGRKKVYGAGGAIGAAPGNRLPADSRLRVNVTGDVNAMRNGCQGRPNVAQGAAMGAWAIWAVWACPF